MKLFSSLVKLIAERDWVTSPVFAYVMPDHHGQHLVSFKSIVLVIMTTRREPRDASVGHLISSQGLIKCQSSPG